MKNSLSKRTSKLLRTVMILWVAVLLLALAGCVGKPPKEEREQAEQAFLAAKAAEKCATVRYTSAEKALQNARRLTTEKKYEEARRYFNVAKELSETALKEANANRDCMNPPDPNETTKPVVTSGGEDDNLTPEERMLRDPEYDLKSVRFPFNSEDITEEAKQILQQNAAWLNNFPDINVRVEGHCDSRGSTEYNLALGERRAYAVRKFLIMLGVNPDQLSVMSYGEESPLVDEENEMAWEQNRRAEFKKVGR